MHIKCYFVSSVVLSNSPILSSIISKNTTYFKIIIFVWEKNISQGKYKNRDFLLNTLHPSYQNANLDATLVNSEYVYDCLKTYKTECVVFLHRMHLKYTYSL